MVAYAMVIVILNIIQENRVSVTLSSNLRQSAASTRKMSLYEGRPDFSKTYGIYKCPPENRLHCL